MRMKSSLLVKTLIGMAIAAVAVAVTGYLWWFEYSRPASFENVVPDRASLIDGVESYLRVDAFLLQLNARSLAYEVERPLADSAKTKRPPFNVTTVKVRQFSDLGYSGELLVEFFNDRLVSARFFPLDTEGYRKQLLSKKGLDLMAQSDTRVSNNTRVWSATDHRGRGYFGWEDVRLTREMELWIKRYS